MSKFIAGHVAHVLFKIMNYLFLNTNFALKLQGKCWKDDGVAFTVHLSVTITHLIRYKQKVVLAAMLEGKSMPMTANTNDGQYKRDDGQYKHDGQYKSYYFVQKSKCGQYRHDGQYKSYYFVQKSKCHKISLLNEFPFKLRVRLFLWALSIFGISKIPTHCLKGALVTWPLSASGLYQESQTTFFDRKGYSLHIRFHWQMVSLSHA